MVGPDALNGIEVVAYILTQGACAGAVENSDARATEAYGIVDEVSDVLQSLVDALAAEVNLGFEIELALALGGVRGDAVKVFPSSEMVPRAEGHERV